MNFKMAVLALLCPIVCIAQVAKINIKRLPDSSLLIQQEIRPFKIGDVIPQVILKTVDHHPGTPMLVSFFATWCGSCIKELPLLNKLRKQSGKNIEMVLITKEKNELVNALKKKNKVFAANTIPILSNDTLWNNLFPHKFIPHLIWISSTGKLVAITGADEVTDSAFTSFIKNDAIQLPVKQDIVGYDRTKPLLENTVMNAAEEVLYQAVFTKFIAGIGSVEGRMTAQNHIRHYYINVPIISLYQRALHFLSNHVFLDVKDPQVFSKTAMSPEDWKEKNLYCYELNLPVSTGAKEKDILMLRDLNSFLPYTGKIEKRMTKCFALVCTDSSALPSASGKAFVGVDGASENYLFTNQPLSVIIDHLNNGDLPIILNESGYTRNISISIPTAALQSIALLRTAFQSYGLDLRETDRALDMFVLTDKINNQH